MSIDKYLNMQKAQYNNAASKWSEKNRDPVVGSYDKHNQWNDYHVYLFKDINTTDKIALEYGAGPGRNIVHFANKFQRIDGVDISNINKEKAQVNCQRHNIDNYNYYVCDGKSIPCKNESYDIVFSVICLQHIPVYSIRKSIINDCYRVIKTNGYFCFQMGFGGKDKTNSKGKVNNWSMYYDETTNADRTNGDWDVSITNKEDVIEDLHSIGFRNIEFDIRPTGPGDNHKNWIWIRAQK